MMLVLVVVVEDMRYFGGLRKRGVFVVDIK